MYVPLALLAISTGLRTDTWWQGSATGVGVFEVALLPRREREVTAPRVAEACGPLVADAMSALWGIVGHCQHGTPQPGTCKPAWAVAWAVGFSVGMRVGCLKPAWAVRFSVGMRLWVCV